MPAPFYTGLSDLLHRKMIEIYDRGLILRDIDHHIKYSDHTPFGEILFPELVPIRPSVVRTHRFHDHSII